ncbi:hypothetical protein BDZ91DRAFT_732731 [Kalaharituber pfeilii]|nr:hypothetical protein BDZ91DRAFT_732731 [Kalaharituber pfeilii]
MGEYSRQRRRRNLNKNMRSLIKCQFPHFPFILLISFPVYQFIHPSVQGCVCFP